MVQVASSFEEVGGKDDITVNKPEDQGLSQKGLRMKELASQIMVGYKNP